MVLAPLTARLSGPWICSSCRLANATKRAPRRALTTPASFIHRSNKLPQTPARTRFAPSPTGHLHLGSLRTALYNYLLAKATGGQFLLRIEDTDQSRTIPGALESICRDLEWTGLQCDEGPKVGGPYGPYIQSERLPLYQEHANILLEKGHAYRCFCTAERLKELVDLRQRSGQPAHYDKTCAGISKEESDDRASRNEKYVVRIRAPTIQPGYDDLVYGRIGKIDFRKGKLGQPDDAILLKSDGRPTYHLANVVDDHLMQITHVIRAVEWMPSTPKHIQLYEAFGWTPPAFAHVGLLQDAEGQKLSKRRGAQDISTFQKSGIFPEALVNFVALLGWYPKAKRDLMDLETMIKAFDLCFTKGNAVVNMPKLAWFMKKYTTKYVQEEGDQFREMNKNAIAMLSKQGITQTPGNRRTMNEYVGAILKVDSSYYSELATSPVKWKSFFVWDAKDAADRATDLKYPAIVEDIHRRLIKLSDEQWSSSNISEHIKEAVFSVTPEKDVSSTKSFLLHDLRHIIMAGNPGIGMADALEILGREESLDRFSKAMPVP